MIEAGVTYQRTVATGEAMEDLGAELVRQFPPSLVYLRGTLGAGKTTLVRGALRALGHAGSVKSPTYTLVEPYLIGDDLEVFHFDLYRISDPQELEFLGFRDYLQQNCWIFLEWPERGDGFLPESPGLSVDISLQASVVGQPQVDNQEDPPRIVTIRQGGG